MMNKSMFSASIFFLHADCFRFMYFSWDSLLHIQYYGYAVILYIMNKNIFPASIFLLHADCFGIFLSCIIASTC